MVSLLVWIAVDRGACRRAVHVQCARAGQLCRVAAICGLAMASFAQRLECCWRYHPWRAQIGERSATRRLGTPLRHHGALQHGRVVSCERAFCFRNEAEPGQKIIGTCVDEKAEGG